MANSPRAHFRLRWPLLVLMASIGLTALAAFDAQRTLRRQDRVVDRAIREFSSFAAWSYGEHLQQQLASAAVEVVGAVNHGENMHTSPRTPEPKELAHYLPYDMVCECHRARAGPNPAAFFGFKLGDREAEIAQNLFAKPEEGWRVDEMPGHLMAPAEPASLPAERKWLADTMTAHARSVPRDDHGYGFLIGRFNGESKAILYTLMPTSWGDTMVYGAVYTPTALARMLARVLDGNGLLPATFTEGKRNRDVVALRVLDAAGNRVFNSAPGLASTTSTELRLSPSLGSVAVAVTIRPEQASSLIIGGSPRSRLPFLLGLLALAAAMSVVAVAQIRRESELAGMRADFVSSISHELRTPLAQIKLYLETVRLGRASTPEQREWSLGHIDRETTRLSNLVENVLRFSRLGRAESPPETPVELGAESVRIVDEFRPLAAARKSTIDLNVGEDSFVLIRPDGLRHVLVNLLDNAIKYGPAGQVVRVDVARRNGSAVLSVTDQGSGVPLGEREKIWDAFARAKTSTEAAGSGIGLTIVRDIVQHLGGKVWVEDAEAGGARFIVALPVASE
jgi:signal transduction histidine kinase